MEKKEERKEFYELLPEIIRTADCPCLHCLAQIIKSVKLPANHAAISEAWEKRIKALNVADVWDVSSCFKRGLDAEFEGLDLTRKQWHMLFGPLDEQDMSHALFRSLRSLRYNNLAEVWLATEKWQNGEKKHEIRLSAYRGSLVELEGLFIDAGLLKKEAAR